MFVEVTSDLSLPNLMVSSYISCSSTDQQQFDTSAPSILLETLFHLASGMPPLIYISAYLLLTLVVSPLLSDLQVLEASQSVSLWICPFLC